MKSQDIVLLLKLISIEQSTPNETELYSLRRLEADTGISKTELSAALKRCIGVGLAAREPGSGLPRTNRTALLGFLIHGIRYVFPAKPGALARGMPTSFAAPVLQKKLMSGGEMFYVWPMQRVRSKARALILCSRA